MDQLTLAQAANYEPPIPERYEIFGATAYTEGHQKGFVVGGNWQKEQYKLILEALELGRGYMKLYLKKMGQNPALGPDPGSALDKVNKAIERLQD